MAQLDPLDGISVFVAAVRAHSFTAAAERLGLSKSAVGKSIARLEARLGVKLFYRTTRKLSLTTDGEAFHRACSGAIEEIARAEQALSATAATPSGRLRIDMPAAFGRRILLPLLLNMARPHPSLQLALSFGDRIVDPIAEGIDLVIRFGELGEHAGLIARKLTSQRLCICASPAYLASHGVPREPGEVGRHQCIVNFRQGAPFSWRLIEDGRPTHLIPPATHEASDGEAIISLTLAGLGLSQMPLCLVSRHIAGGELVSVLEPYAEATIPVHALWPATRHLTPRVRFVVDELVRMAARGDLDGEAPSQTRESTAMAEAPEGSAPHRR